MSKIKVLVNNTEQANELIDYWKEKGVDLEIKIKENTTAANSDVDLASLSVLVDVDTSVVLEKLLEVKHLLESIPPVALTFSH